MRPALLVIIMDFLISSLLLFINDENQGIVAGERRAPEQAAREFSTEAIAQMETEWMRDYQDQFRDKKIADQENMLAQLTGRTRQLTEEKNSLVTRIAEQDTTITKQKSEAETMAREIKTLTEKQIQTAESLTKVKNEAETLAREKNDLAAAKERLEKMAASLAEAKARGDQLLKEAEEKQKNMASQNEQLRASLAAQAEAIRVQNETVASQQQVISKALVEVAQAQTRIDSRTEALLKGQTQMQSTLTNLQAVIERLPAELAAGTSLLVKEQQRLNGVITGLTALASALEAGFKPEQQKAITEKLDALTAANKAITEKISIISVTNNMGKIADDLYSLRLQQQSLQGDISMLVSSMQAADARRAGPLSACEKARVAVVTELCAEKSTGIEAIERHLSRYSVSVFVPLLTVGNRKYAVAHIQDYGLDWWGVSKYLTNAAVRIGLAGHIREMAVAKGPLQILPGDWRAVMIDCSADDGLVAALEKAPAPEPMKIIGKEGFEKRGNRDVYLFKRSTGGLGLAVETAPDPKDRRYLVVRRTLRPALEKIVSFLFVNPDSRQEPGDFLVTAEGDAIGIMVDNERCLILTPEYFASPSMQIPLDNPREFVNQVLQLRKAAR